jgi:hypothetical protein
MKQAVDVEIYISHAVLLCMCEALLSEIRLYDYNLPDPMKRKRCYV